MNNSQVPVIRGAQQAMERFRYEMARELGLPTGSSAYGVRKPLPNTAIIGSVPKRMVALAERQMEMDGP